MSSDDIENIIDTAEIAEDEWDGQSDPDDVPADLAATVQPTGKGMEFHVSMSSYTLAEMDNLIVEAAARQIVGRRTDAALSKQIEERCMELVTEAIDKRLHDVTADIVNRPLTPVGYGKQEPMTMAEAIGLQGREYLEMRVNKKGEPVSGSSGGWRTEYQTRAEWLVIQHLDRTFKKAIEEATKGAVVEMKGRIDAAMKEYVKEEKARIVEAVGWNLRPPKR